MSMNRQRKAPFRFIRCISYVLYSGLCLLHLRVVPGEMRGEAAPYSLVPTTECSLLAECSPEDQAQKRR